MASIEEIKKELAENRVILQAVKLSQDNEQVQIQTVVDGLNKIIEDMKAGQVPKEIIDEVVSQRDILTALKADIESTIPDTPPEPTPEG